MGPHKNAQLYETLAGHNVEAVQEEFLRRSLIGGNLQELSQLFGEKENTEHIVTNPTVIVDLFALSQIQKTEMGVAGFLPLAAVDESVPGGQVDAKAAPHHDEVSDNGLGGLFRTRVIQFSLPYQYSSDIDIFGLNFYQPDMDIESPTSGGLLIVGDTGSLEEKQQPITGAIVVYAVRNKRTKDAKIYQVTHHDPESDEVREMEKAKIPVIHKTKNKSLLTLPNGMVVTIERLTGDLQNQATSEFEMGIRALKDKDVNGSKLSDIERSAVSEVISSNGSEYL